MPTSPQREARNARRRELRHLREDALRSQQNTTDHPSNTIIALHRRGPRPREISPQDRRALRTARQRELRQIQRNNTLRTQGLHHTTTTQQVQTFQQTPSESGPRNLPENFISQDTNIPSVPARRMGRRPRNISSEDSRLLRNARRRELRQLHRNIPTPNQETLATTNSLPQQPLHQSHIQPGAKFETCNSNGEVSQIEEATLNSCVSNFRLLCYKPPQLEDVAISGPTAPLHFSGKQILESFLKNASSSFSNTPSIIRRRREAHSPLLSDSMQLNEARINDGCDDRRIQVSSTKISLNSLLFE
ncbi:hypothetical protein KSP39_PZI018417 [Platanthera zijinensis]|uniref:Uncharacterized protein n=1 Tax=Platanthera zijinensis TaxID=2320716 RepID=A0AAP0B421_9ASPA